MHISYTCIPIYINIDIHVLLLYTQTASKSMSIQEPTQIKQNADKLITGDSQGICVHYYLCNL